jgi:hypothetical protein
MLNSPSEPKNPTLIQLQSELARVRAASLEASRKGDYLRVASLTGQAASLNRRIMDIKLASDDNRDLSRRVQFGI